MLSVAMSLLVCDIGGKQERKDVLLCPVDKGSVVLTNFVLTWHESKTSERRESQLRKQRR